MTTLATGRAPVVRNPRGSATTPRVPAAVPAGLLLATLPLLRPGTLGEYTALIGAGVALAAGVAAMLRRETAPTRPVRAVSVFLALLVAAYLWLVLHTVWVEDLIRIRSQFQDFALTVGSVVAAVLVLNDPRARLALGRGFVLVLCAIGALWLVTALWWAVAGVGTGQIGMIPVGTVGPQPVYLPFTVSYSTSSVFGMDVPRLTGIGRESGWMAMYCAAGWFLAEAVGYRSWLVRGLILAGLIGTLSTAGFGVFVVVLAVEGFLRPRGGIGLGGFLRQVGGLGAIVGAAWIALYAPVFGLQAKQTSNEASLDERSDATEAGIRALTTKPWGGQGTEKQAGINLISDIAVNGLPFVLLVTAALLVPLLLVRPARGTRGRAAPVAFVVFATLLLSQPAAASTWVFVLVALALACDDLTEAERHAPGDLLPRRLQRRLGIRDTSGAAS
ncbi:hypothetical protein [Actinomycetospora soli]|uniref:hypothetical protein n=1 Tax=Actinomycetospora soli TaxID=2893887 RepID=UPI001E492296|nr:hypothetical protein [Actinomycetospora soli]MCD2187969.1 hypothetical protein [Actinomycetospora soli]